MYFKHTATNYYKYNRIMSRTHSTVKEDYRLSSRQDGWNLAGGASITSSRTRHAGAGRPKLTKGRLPNEEESSSDSEYEKDSLDEDDESDSEEYEWEEEEEESEEEQHLISAFCPVGQTIPTWANGRQTFDNVFWLRICVRNGLQH
jgi:hypothetical protein